MPEALDNMGPVVRDGYMPTHKGPGTYTKLSRQEWPEELFERHFGMDWMTEAATRLENYCADKSNPRTSDLIWIECSCGNQFLRGDDYICRECRALV